jgi:hypothetical protein
MPLLLILKTEGPSGCIRVVGQFVISSIVLFNVFP